MIDVVFSFKAGIEVLDDRKGRKPHLTPVSKDRSDERVEKAVKVLWIDVSPVNSASQRKICKANQPLE